MQQKGGDHTGEGVAWCCMPPRVGGVAAGRGETHTHCLFVGWSHFSSVMLRRALLSRAVEAAAVRRFTVRALCDDASAALTHHEVPRHLVAVTHSRSSGSGGQNVNKVATKVTLRLPLSEAASCLPADLVDRLREQQHWRVNKADELMVQCDEERTQGRNLKLAFARLQSMVDAASVVPKERVVSLELSRTRQGGATQDEAIHGHKEARAPTQLRR